MNSRKAIIFWLIIALAATFGWYSIKTKNAPQDSKEISYSQFLSQVESGSVASVRISDTSIEGTSRDGGAFRVNVPSNQDQMVQTLRQKGVEIWYTDNHKSTTNWIMHVAPLALLAILWLFMIRQMSRRAKLPPTVPPGGSQAPWPGN